jgi:hypothetical protein
MTFFEKQSMGPSDEEMVLKRSDGDHLRILQSQSSLDDANITLRVVQQLVEGYNIIIYNSP